MKHKSILLFALAGFAFTALPSQAQLILQFEQQGLSTQVTGSGSATTGGPGIVNNVGFFAPFPLGGPLSSSTIPAGWVPNIVFDSGGASAAGSALTIGGVPLTSLGYSSDPGVNDFLFFTPGALIPALTLVTAAGTDSFLDPYTALFANHAPGTVLEIIPGVLHFIIGIAPVEVVTTIGGHRRVVRSYLTTNYSAIASAEGSGMMMGHMLQSSAQSAADTVLRDLRGEIFADGFESGDTAAWSSSDAGNSSSLLRYFAFMQDENTSYKVALGLADPEERTIEVNVSDTLMARNGVYRNGATLGGGLPYAMMGVPMMPMIGGAATVQIVEAGGGKTVIDDAKAVVETAPMKRWRMFASGDFSFYDQDPLTDLIEGFETDTYAGSIGFDYNLNEWLKAGLAWSYVQSDTNASDSVGNLDLEGNMISVFTTVNKGSNWADLLYSYGSFDNDISRNTGLGSRARGDTDSDSHNVRLNLGHNINVGSKTVTGPVAGLRYGRGDVDAYSERGGSVGALDYAGTDFESMISRVGWQASHAHPTTWGRIVSQVRLAWEHEFMPENGTVSGALQTSPFALVTGGTARSIGGYTATSDGAHPGTDWLSAGAGVRFDLSGGLSLHADYEGVFFRSDAGQHYASAKVSYEW